MAVISVPRWRSLSVSISLLHRAIFAGSFLLVTFLFQPRVPISGRKLVQIIILMLMDRFSLFTPANLIIPKVPAVGNLGAKFKKFRKEKSWKKNFWRRTYSS